MHKLRIFEGYFSDTETDDSAENMLDTELTTEWPFMVSITYSVLPRDVRGIQEHAAQTANKMRAVLENTKFVGEICQEPMLTLPAIVPDFSHTAEILECGAEIQTSEKYTDKRIVEKIFFDQKFISVSVPFTLSGKVTSRELTKFVRNCAWLLPNVYCNSSRLGYGMVFILTNILKEKSEIYQGEMPKPLIEQRKCVETFSHNIFDTPEADTDIFSIIKILHVTPDTIVNTIYGELLTDVSIYKIYTYESVPMDLIETAFKKEEAFCQKMDFLKDVHFKSDVVMNYRKSLGNYIESDKEYYVILEIGYYDMQVHIMPKREYPADEQDTTDSGVIRRVRVLVYNQGQVKKIGTELLERLGIGLHELSQISKETKNIFMRGVIEKVCAKLRK